MTYGSEVFVLMICLMTPILAPCNSVTEPQKNPAPTFQDLTQGLIWNLLFLHAISGHRRACYRTLSKEKAACRKSYLQRIPAQGRGVICGFSPQKL